MISMKMLACLAVARPVALSRGQPFGNLDDPNNGVPPGRRCALGKVEQAGDAEELEIPIDHFWLELHF